MKRGQESSESHPDRYNELSDRQRIKRITEVFKVLGSTGTHRQVEISPVGEVLPVPRLAGFFRHKTVE